MNLPFDTYLRDCRVTLYGGILRGVETLNISLDGSFTIYPPARLNNSAGTTDNEFTLNSITVLDGGAFRYMGVAEDDNQMNVILNGSLHVLGGGEFHANNLNLQGKIEISSRTNDERYTERKSTCAGRGRVPRK